MRIALRVGLIVGLLLLGVRQAATCSVAVPTLESLAGDTPLIIVGTISNAQENTASLEVEQYLKGGDGEHKISIINHAFSLDAQCQTLLGEGNHWIDGMRLLAFLQPATFDLGADWQAGFLGDWAVFVITDDTIQMPSGEQLPLANAITRITGAPSQAATTPDLTDLPLPAPPRLPPFPGQEGPAAPLPLPVLVPTSTPLSSAEDTASSAGLANTAPWILLGVGVVAGLGAVFGMLRARRLE